MSAHVDVCSLWKAAQVGSALQAELLGRSWVCSGLVFVPQQCEKPSSSATAAFHAANCALQLLVSQRAAFGCPWVTTEQLL